MVTQNGYTLEYYIEAARRNDDALSRTAKGTYEIGAGAGKPTIATKDYLARNVVLNRKRAIWLLHEGAMPGWSKLDSTPGCAGALIRETYERMHGTILNAPLLRTHDITGKDYGYPVASLPQEFERFTQWFAQQRDGQLPLEELMRAIAMTETIIEMPHFFADGCGRLSRLLSLYLCMRNDQPVPLHTDKAAYYDTMKPCPTPEKLYLPETHERRLAYYKTLSVL